MASIPGSVGDDVVALAVVSHRHRVSVLLEDLVADDVMAVTAQDAAQQHDVERVRAHLEVDVARVVLDEEALPERQRLVGLDGVRQFGLGDRVSVSPLVTHLSFILLFMKTDITPEQAEAYRADGFLVVEDFLSPAEVSELGDAVEEAVALMGNRKISSGPDWRDGDGFYERVFKQRLNLWMINQVVKRYVLAPALGRMLCALANTDGIRV